MNLLFAVKGDLLKQAFENPKRYCGFHMLVRIRRCGSIGNIVESVMLTDENDHPLF
jgi:hypothetical protein